MINTQINVDIRLTFDNGNGETREECESFELKNASAFLAGNRLIAQSAELEEETLKMIQVQKDLDLRIIRLVDYMIDVGCSNTISGSWCFDHCDIACFISPEMYERYKQSIIYEIQSRNEVVSTNVDGNGSVIIYFDVRYCQYYEWNQSTSEEETGMTYDEWAAIDDDDYYPEHRVYEYFEENYPFVTR